MGVAPGSESRVLQRRPPCARPLRGRASMGVAPGSESRVLQRRAPVRAAAARPCSTGGAAMGGAFGTPEGGVRGRGDFPDGVIAAAEDVEAAEEARGHL